MESEGGIKVSQKYNRKILEFRFYSTVNNVKKQVNNKYIFSKIFKLYREGVDI